MSELLPVTIIPPPPSSAPPEVDGKDHALFALLVGVSRFGKGLCPLPGATRDMSALHMELSQHHRYPSTHVTLVANPNRNALLDHLAKWQQNIAATPGSKGLLYFSTHGFYVDDQYQLCTTDSTLTDPHPTHTLSWGELRTLLSPLQQHPLLLVLDTCRNQLTSHAKGLQPGLPKHREDIALRGEYWAVWTAASYGEFAQERSTSQTGPAGLFSQSFLHTLQTAPDTEPAPLEYLYHHTKEHLQAQLTTHNFPLTQEPRLYLGQLDCSKLAFFHTIAPPLSQTGLRSIVGLSLLLLVALLLFLGGKALQQRHIHTPTTPTCQQCITSTWRTQRQTDCRALHPLAKTSITMCQLPCNFANFRTVIQRCQPTCATQPANMKQVFRREIQRLTATSSISATQCTQLLQGALQKVPSHTK